MGCNVWGGERGDTGTERGSPSYSEQQLERDEVAGNGNCDHLCHGCKDSRSQCVLFQNIMKDAAGRWVGSLRSLSAVHLCCTPIHVHCISYSNLI